MCDSVYAQPGEFINKELAKRWWDTHVANNYFTGFCFSFSRPELISLFKIKEDTKVLEIGFGYGRETSQFCLLSKNVYGVDLAENAKDIALEKIATVANTSVPKLYSYDGKTLPFENDFFGFVYNCFVMQHMSKSSAIDLLKECKRVLHPNGYMLFEFFGYPVFYRPGLEENVFSGDPGATLKNDFSSPGGIYNNAYTPAEIELMINQAGLKMHWCDVQLIDNSKNFNNYWVCMVK